MTYKRRHCEEYLQTCLEVAPVVVVTGARQVGKSTLVQNPAIGRDRKFYTLDDYDILGAIQRNPSTILHRSGSVTIDEVQLGAGNTKNNQAKS